MQIKMNILTNFACANLNSHFSQAVTIIVKKAQLNKKTRFVNKSEPSNIYMLIYSTTILLYIPFLCYLATNRLRKKKKRKGRGKKKKFMNFPFESIDIFVKVFFVYFELSL